MECFKDVYTFIQCKYSKQYLVEKNNVNLIEFIKRATIEDHVNDLFQRQKSTTVFFFCKIFLFVFLDLIMYLHTFLLEYLGHLDIFIQFKSFIDVRFFIFFQIIFLLNKDVVTFISSTKILYIYGCKFWYMFTKLFPCILFSILFIIHHKILILGRSHEVGSTFQCHLINQKHTSEVQIKNAYVLLMVCQE